MIEHDSDEARIARRRRLIEVRPLAAKDMLREFDYLREYEQPHVITTDNVEAIEATHKCLFCPACRKTEGALTKARKLHVSYGPDLLNNYPLIATVRCSCGWNEMIPAIKEEVSVEDQHDAMKYEADQRSLRHQQQKQAMLTQQYAGQSLGDPRLTAQQVQQQQQYAMDQMRAMMGINPFHTGVVDKIPFGQKLADQVWQELDKIKEIRAAAARHRQRTAEEQQMKAYATGAGKAMAVTLDNDMIKKALDILDSKVVPPWHDKYSEPKVSPTPRGPTDRFRKIYDGLKKCTRK